MPPEAAIVDLILFEAAIILYEHTDLDHFFVHETKWWQRTEEGCGENVGVFS